MDQEFERSVKNITWALRKIVSLIYHESKSMAKKYGVTGPQGFVIKSLYASPTPLSSADLSRRLFVTPSNMTGIIDRLEDKGLVTRVKKEKDRRTTLIVLTEKGREYGKILPDLIEKQLMQGLWDLSPTEIFGIYSALDTIIGIIEKEK
jgi:DNA-binding MarR family transcriptional regulator